MAGPPAHRGAGALFNRACATRATRIKALRVTRRVEDEIFNRHTIVSQSFATQRATESLRVPVMATDLDHARVHWALAAGADPRADPPQFARRVVGPDMDAVGKRNQIIHSEI
jgi:hypothetical protein